MKISILPKSALGWWSVGLLAAMILVAVVDTLLLKLSVVENQPGSVSLMILGAAFGILDIGILVTGILSIVKRKQGSILVLLVLALALFLWAFLPGFWIPNWGS
jgi:hypothetical protein